MKLSTNTYRGLLLITAGASLLGIAGCSDLTDSSAWARPGPAYLYDEIALPAGGGGGGISASVGGHSAGGSAGGHSGGSSSGGGK